jgi:hypothetical protein
MRKFTTLLTGVVAVGALGLPGGAAPPPAPAPAPVPAQAWRLFADDVPADRRGSFETVGREYGLSSDPSAPRDDPDSRSLVVQVGTGRVVHRFRPEAPDRQAYRAVFTDRYAMILDGSYTKADAPDLARDQSVLWRVDLGTGERTRFVPTTVKSMSLSEQMTELGTSVVVPAVSGDDRSCLIAVDVVTLRDTLLHCAPAGATILRVDSAAGGLSWLQATGSTYADCKSRWWRDPSGTVTQLAPEAGCGIWEGVRLGDWTFTAALAGRDEREYDFSHAIASDGKSTVDFGRMLTSTVVACGDHVYWLAADEATQQEWQEVRRWKPGDAQYEVVLRTEGDAGRRPPACTQGVLTISNTRTVAEPNYVRTRYLTNP